MATYLLVHGSWHGAWCWARLLPALRARGHEAVAIDLPAHGADRTAPSRTGLLAYARAIHDAAATLPEKPLVVGHSMAGAAITRAASLDSEPYRALVYLCAFVPRPGESVVRLGLADRRSRVVRSLRPHPAGAAIRPARAKALFYNACSEGDARWATAQLRPEPWRAPLERYRAEQPLTLPRAYVECTRDRTISIDRQRFMARREPMQRIASLDTDHSPFLSAPDALAEVLGRMADLGD